MPLLLLVFYGLCLWVAIEREIYRQEVVRLRARPPVILSQRERVEQLENKVNSLENERDYYKALSEGRVITE